MPHQFCVNRRALLMGAAATSVASLIPRSVLSQANMPPALTASTEFVEVDTIEGRLRGQRQGEITTFRGVRYANPPLGAFRFRNAPPLAKWKGVRDALVWGHPAIQPPHQTFGVGEPAPDEDCLVLNIWTPSTKDARKRPVMFYCHGGGFWTGSAASVMQDGANLARENDVVVVESNHRLGIMGYLFLDDVAGGAFKGSANTGMLDIVAALAWTKRNIEAFGGDPSNVMVWGESGGGAKTSCIYAMPSASAYFHKASIESGPGVRMTERDQASRTTHWVLEKLGLTVREAHKLRDIPAATLLQIQMTPPPNGGVGLRGGRHGIGASRLGEFSPVVDGVVLPTHPFDPTAPAISADKPLIVGSNRDEIVFFYMNSPDKSVFTLDEPGLVAHATGLFGDNASKLLAAYRQGRPDASPTEVAVAMESAAFAGAGSIAIAERKAVERRAPVYMYLLTDHINALVSGTDYPIGAMHAMDIRLKFDNLAEGDPGHPSQSPEEAADHHLAAKNMSRFWAAFARTNQPAAPGQPAWIPYDLQKRATMMIGPHCHVANDPYPVERAVWTDIG